MFHWFRFGDKGGSLVSVMLGPPGHTSYRALADGQDSARTATHLHPQLQPEGTV